MDYYLLLKSAHIFSATILFGAGVGSAFYLFMANRRRELGGICFATHTIVLADKWFTGPAGLVQLLTGLGLVHVAGYSFSEPWLIVGSGLYVFTGMCWLPVVRIQIIMRDIAAQAQANGSELTERYWVLARRWTILGSMAFPAMVAVIVLMVYRPW